MSLANLQPVQAAILTWFAREGRDLPWRQTRAPYAILVSEIMLQQTQVDRVLPKYREFLAKFPTFAALAAAGTGDVLRVWTPLGYNQRAVRLQRIARQVVEKHNGMLPSDPAELRALEGVGEYTASALECFALEKKVALVDVNVRRVLGRTFRGTDILGPKESWALAWEALPPGKAWDWNQALMDVGATVCSSRKPRCELCPVRGWCRGAEAFQSGSLPVIAETRAAYKTASSSVGTKKAIPFKGSNRYYRGRVLACLRNLPDGASIGLVDVAVQVERKSPEGQEATFQDLVLKMHADGLVRLERDGLPATWKLLLP